MQFENSEILYLLLCMPLLALFLLWAYRLYRRRLYQFADKLLLKELLNHYEPRLKLLKFVFVFCIFGLALLALSRPQWGFEWQEVNRKGLDIIVAIDVSKSMLAQDVKPSRLERTKLAVQDLIKQMKGDRIGLVAFAGDAFLMCPLTSDYNGFLLSLEDLSVESIPVGGTNVGLAIETAIEGHEDVANEFKTIIVVTDGDNLEGDPLKVAEKAHKDGIKVYTVGIGTPDGELIQVSNESGQSEFLKDRDGNFVKSRLNEGLLQQIALQTNAVYVRAQGAQFGLDYIYQSELSQLETRSIETKQERIYYERFQFPLGLAIILLMIESCLGYYSKQS